MNTYNHYSNKTIDKIYNTDKSKKVFNEYKPIGLWFSKNDEWSIFNEDTGLFAYNHKYNLNLDFSNILVIDTFEKLKNFHNKYSYLRWEGTNIEFIKWAELYDIYDGIYFDNYYEIKNSLMFDNKYIWFYTIDVNSGCIFNAKCVKSFNLNDSNRFVK